MSSPPDTEWWKRIPQGSTHITLGAAGLLNDLTPRLTFFPERVILPPGGDRTLRYMVEGIDALPDGGHITLLHFTMRERAAVHEAAVPAVATAINIEYSVVAPLTLLGHRTAPTLSARVLAEGDSTLALLLTNTSSHPFIGAVHVHDGEVRLGSASAVVYTRRRIDVPVTARPIGAVLTLTFTSDLRGPGAHILRFLTPPPPVEVYR